MPSTSIVLIVDDEEQVRSLVSKILLRSGFATIKVADAPSAIAKVEALGGVIRAVITDIEMAGMNGIDLALRIRSAHLKFR